MIAGKRTLGKLINGSADGQIHSNRVMSITDHGIQGGILHIYR